MITASVHLGDIEESSSYTMTFNAGLIEQDMLGRAEAVLRSLGKTMMTAMYRMLTKPGGGRTYRSKAMRGGLHVASAPGAPPATDTGAYVGSWNYDVTRTAEDVTLSLGTPLWDVFGRRLELGGSDSKGVYIAARPHVRPMMDGMGEQIQEGFDQL